MHCAAGFGRYFFATVWLLVISALTLAADDAEMARQIQLRSQAALEAVQAITATFETGLLTVPDPTAPEEDRGSVVWRLAWKRNAGWRLESRKLGAEVCDGQNVMRIDEARQTCELLDYFDAPSAVLRRVHLLDDLTTGPPPYPQVGYDAFVRKGPPTIRVREEKLGDRQCFTVSLEFRVAPEESAKLGPANDVDAERYTFTVERDSFLILGRVRELRVAGKWTKTEELRDVAYDAKAQISPRALALEPPAGLKLSDLRTGRVNPLRVRPGQSVPRSDAPYPEGGAACNAESWWQWHRDQVLACADAAEWRVILHGIELLASNELFVYVTRWNMAGSDYVRDQQPDIICRDDQGRVYVPIIGADHVVELWKVWLVPLAAATYGAQPPQKLELTIRPYPQGLALAPDEPIVVVGDIAVPQPLTFEIPPMLLAGLDDRQREDLQAFLASQKAEARQLYALRQGAR